MGADTNRHEGNTSNPDYFGIYLRNLKSEGRAHSEQAERKAYSEMQLKIEREKNREIKHFMQDTLEYYCIDGSMLLSYIYENYWDEWVKKQKYLQRAIQPMELYIALESILADKSDSSEYTKTPGGPRYPLTIPGNYPGQPENRVRHVGTDVSGARFLKSYYKFGVHKFHVGSAVKNILDYLEDRYDLDFKELERSRQRAVNNNS